MISNPYLSQIERGLHEPSIRVVKAIAKALDISTETLLAQVGLLDDEDRPDGRIPGATEAAISADPYLTDGAAGSAARRLPQLRGREPSAAKRARAPSPRQSRSSGLLRPRATAGRGPDTTTSCYGSPPGGPLGPVGVAHRALPFLDSGAARLTGQATGWLEDAEALPATRTLRPTTSGS